MSCLPGVMEMSDETIHVLMGTKGQFIKMAPILKELDKRGIDYNFIHSGQHTEITKKISELFELRKPDVVLDERNEDITKIGQAVYWNLKNMIKSVINRKDIFQNRRGICLVHGDAVSALQGLIMAKLAKIKVAHIEAGERTHSLYEPFPEELVRVLVDRYADYLFASSDISYENLINEKVRGQVFNVHLNTICDSIRIAIENDIDIEIPSDDYVLATIHRFETIKSKERSRMVVRTLEDIALERKVLFPIHRPTRIKFESYGLMERLEANKNIFISELYDYFSFLKLIKNSNYIVTDGGGPQEESFFLGVPCLLLRKTTERMSHPNVYLSEFKTEKIKYFIDNYFKFKIKSQLSNFSPSKQIVDIIEEIVEK
ncbi:hypothetical protein CW713_04555 [Methanophagales archaeon]|nr:MAG: hypothetical protein CW713_04555 [Methanophagales archaeon]